MFVDARSIPEATTVDADLCIIGAGAAGITLALEFRGFGGRTILLEAGGVDGDAETTQLNDGTSVGAPYPPLIASRARIFGGTTSMWGGWCMPATAADFQRKAWIPYSGWPIRRESLDPYYVKAHEICDLGPYNYEIDFWVSKGYEIPKQFGGSRLESIMTQFSPPTRFGPKYQQAIETAQDVTTYLHANAVRLDTDRDGNSVQSIQVRTLTGRAFSVRAKHVVLAASGIENARLLLSSPGRSSRGVGNEHDLVGRFFADHYLANVGELWLTDESVNLRFFQHHVAPQGQVKGYLRPTPAVQRMHELGETQFTLDPVYDPFYYDAARSEGAESLQQILSDAANGRLPDEFGAHLLNVLRDLDDVAIATYRKLRYEEFPIDHYRIEMGVVPVPNRESRVKLGDEVDAVGMRKVVLDWRIDESDKKTFLTARRLFAEEIGRLGIGRVKLDDNENAPWPHLEKEAAQTAFHQLGTTRMSEDAKQGVVDTDCRVHGMRNLFVAGSSVFPSYEGEPTLMIVAFALRLSEHLKRKLKGA